MAIKVQVDRDVSEFYRDIAAAAESGWDFSSRWFDDEENLSTVITSKIIPVDLNVILFKVEKTLSEFSGILNNNENKKKFD